MIKKKMLEKMLPDELVESKLEELLDEDAEMEIAKKYAEKNFGKVDEIKNLPYEERQKFLRKILSRGIRMSVATSFLES